MFAALVGKQCRHTVLTRVLSELCFVDSHALTYNFKVIENDCISEFA